jgi:hypothetical protein
MMTSKSMEEIEQEYGTRLEFSRAIPLVFSVIIFGSLVNLIFLQIQSVLGYVPHFLNASSLEGGGPLTLRHQL